MSFDKLWKSLAQKKGIGPDNEVTISEPQLRNLCQQFFDAGERSAGYRIKAADKFKQVAGESNPLADLFKNMGLGG